MKTHLNIGDKAPAFSLQNQNEEVISLETLKGKKLILFFYPKDNTPGCTAEACSLRDGYQTFLDAGYVILGISPDSPKSHTKFITKHELPFDLLADTEKEMLNAYGVWGLKKFMGREYDGVHRTTFVLDEDHIITQIVAKVKTKTHNEQLAELLEL